MSEEKRFTNREITLMFQEIKLILAEQSKENQEIISQVRYTNGKVRNLTKWLLMIGTISATLLVTNGSEVLSVIKLII